MKLTNKRNLTKIFIILFLIFGIFIINTYAGATEFEKLVGNSEIKGLSNKLTGTENADGNIIKVVQNTGINILGIIKTILEGVLLIYIIYIGIQMVISMGTDEDKLSKGKSQLRYSLVAIMFINIPGTLYNVINSDYNTDISKDRYTTTGGSIIINTKEGTGGFGWLLNNIVSFIEVIIFGLAIFTIIMHGIKIMTSRGREEEVTKAKTKILYSLIAGIFVGFIEGWRRLAISSDLSQGGELFGNMTKVTLVFAGPVAIFFLTLAGYYYITSNGDEERTKKAKSIIINTVIGVILLLAMFTFLNDLVKF